MRLVRRRDLAGTDRPNGLVRDDDVFPVRRGHDVVHRLELRAANIQSRARFALFQRLTDAQSNLQSLAQGIFGLLPDELVRLAAERAAFAVPENHPRNVGVGEHIRAHLTRERPTRGDPTVLRGDGVVFVVELLLHSRNEDERRRDVDVNVGVDFPRV